MPEEGQYQVVAPGHWPFKAYNRNVSAVFIVIGAFAFASQFGSSLSTIFVYKLTGDRTSYTGYPIALKSIVNLVLQFPVAWWADVSESKSLIMRTGCYIQLVNIASNLAILYLAWSTYASTGDPTCLTCFYWLLAASVLDGCGQSFIQSPSAAIIGNSTKLGDRTNVTTKQQQIFASMAVLGQ